MRSRRSAWVGVVAVVLLSLTAASPGLMGSWVYDDWWMQASPLYRHGGDIPATLTRTSTDYLRRADQTPEERARERGGAYRPMTMLTLVTTHVVAPNPVAHHVVGYALHLLGAGMLFSALRGRRTADAAHEVAAFGVASLYLLHPIGVEAYVWINGRSDVVAGVFLAALAWMLAASAASSDRALPRTPVAAAALVFLGGASKETFLPAAAFLILANMVGRPRAFVRSVVGGALAGAAILFVIRASVDAASGGGFANGRSVLGDADLLRFLPRYACAALDSMLTLRGSTMDSLADLAMRPLSTSEWVVSGFAAFAVAGLVAARDVRGLLLVVGAFACLAPTAVVSRAIWLGFDRYLYMPLLMLGLAAAPHIGRALARVPERLSGLVGIAHVLVLFAAAAGTYVGSSAYRSEASFRAALFDERPRDATVIVYMACLANVQSSPAETHAWLRSLPSPPWPDAVVIPLVVCAERVGDPEILRRALEVGLRQAPDDPLIRAHGMRLRYRQGRIDEALALARTFEGDAALCPEVRRQLDLWGRSREGGEGPTRSAAAARALRCP